jgi:hypothetical protein
MKILRQAKRLTTCGLAKACAVLAPDAASQVGAEGSPLNKNILVVRLGRKVHHILTAFAKP